MTKKRQLEAAIGEEEEEERGGKTADWRTQEKRRLKDKDRKANTLTRVVVRRVQMSFLPLSSSSSPDRSTTWTGPGLMGGPVRERNISERQDETTQTDKGDRADTRVYWTRGNRENRGRRT